LKSGFKPKFELIEIAVNNQETAKDKENGAISLADAFLRNKAVALGKSKLAEDKTRSQS